MQRYGAFLWSGDVYSFWETLKTHIPVAINTGLSGIPYWGTDIGGFVPTADYTGELHVRWFQFGTFCPSFRAHGRNWHLRLPWGWNMGKIPPSELRGYTGGAADPDPKELNNPRVEPIVKKYLELRYRLLPYTYTAARECCDTGLPMMRALWLHHANDPQAVARGDQFLWGRDLLVSPVVEKGAASRRLYLPRGTWFDFWTEDRVEGGREIDRAVDLETMPLHVRAGAIIPMGPIKQYVDEPVDAPLTVTIYPGADGAYELYEDDGKTFAHRKGDWMRLAMAWDDARRRFSLALAPGSRMRPPLTRTLEVRVAGSQGDVTSGSDCHLQRQARAASSRCRWRRARTASSQSHVDFRQQSAFGSARRVVQIHLVARTCPCVAAPRQPFLLQRRPGARQAFIATFVNDVLHNVRRESAVRRGHPGPARFPAA